MDLTSAPSLVEQPFIIVKIGEFTFGDATKSSSINQFGLPTKATFPDMVKSLEVTKVSGQIGTYTIHMCYQLRQGVDPNLMDRIFSWVSKDRRMSIMYGDWNTPTNIYKEEDALITKVTSTIGTQQMCINYDISQVSTSYSLTQTCYNFAQRHQKPSTVINEILNNKMYGVSNVLTGMNNKAVVKQKGLIASNDKEVDLLPKTNVSVYEYMNYATSCMQNETSDTNSQIGNSIYTMTIYDDVSNEYGGPYMKVQEVQKGYSTPYNAYSIDVGYPGNNLVTSFSVDTTENWTLLYDVQDSQTATQQNYSYYLDKNGEYVPQKSVGLTRSSQNFKTTQDSKAWWTKVTQFPITQTITIKGLIRPTLLMDYVKLNVVFYGQRHISSGLYVITHQQDSVSGSGFKTTLKLLRVKEDA